jgi:2-isopropylmalate synthase
MTVELYDTTLRDGAQAEGISFSVQDKLRVAKYLDEFGFHYIEGGWPGSNPKDVEFFELAKKENWKNTQLAAFTMTRRAGLKAEDDPNLQTILAAETPIVTMVGKSWDFHVTEALRVSLDENLKMIEESVALMVRHGRRVFYDCEHFFDAFKRSREYAMQTLKAAQNGGAEVLVLCDTNGGSMPEFIAEGVAAVKSTFGMKVGIHTHNDCELGVANALAAVAAGATQVQGTINGFGERNGNCNLVSVLANLQLKKNIQIVPDEKMRQLTHLSHFVSEVANLTPDDRQPFVGKSVFAHKGGMHADAVQKAGGEAYEHITPESVGNERRILVSEQAGTSNVREVAAQAGIVLEKGSPQAKQILQEVKRLESEGWEFEGADASFELLIRRIVEKPAPLFDVQNVRVINEWRHDGNGNSFWTTEATLKLQVNGESFHTAAEGDGPVHALDNALRKALVNVYPDLKKIHLTDFKVRVVNGKQGTAAKVRVLLDAADDENNWSTVGVSTNIIEASWLALRESVEYGLR